MLDLTKLKTFADDKLTLSQTSPSFHMMCLLYKSFKTLWEKEKSPLTNNFSFSHNVFYPFGELPAIVI